MTVWKWIINDIIEYTTADERISEYVDITKPVIIFNNTFMQYKYINIGINWFYLNSGFR